MAKGITHRTEDEVRDYARVTLGFDKEETAIKQGAGQITTFNQLEFEGINDRPDGWYLPDDKNTPAIILETKSESANISLQKWVSELEKNCNIVLLQYKQVIGILYNGLEIRVFKNNVEISTIAPILQEKYYYISLFTKDTIDKQRIYALTKRINDCLHTEFGIKNLYHRMIFTACALVSCRYNAVLIKGMDYSTFHNSIYNTLAKSLIMSKKQNQKLDLLLEVYAEIRMNSTENQMAIDNFIDWVKEISDCVNSDFWNGEDVMGIFFNEFNRYKNKSERGQIFTPDHITSFMYRLIDINLDDIILDGACGSGAFLVKSMCNMTKEAGGINTKKASEIKERQLYGIEFDREIFALACANMLIHKDGKTNLEQLDTRTDDACNWIKSKKITKVLMNPPFERKYGCLSIVENVLKSVPINTKCAFILPDKKLEKDNGFKLLKHSTLHKIIKLSEKTFSEGISVSIFIFESGIPQKDKEILTCYIEEDGLYTVKNQGRQDIKDNWHDIEDTWVDIIRKQSGDNTVKWIKPSEKCLSYQKPEKEFEISDKDFTKVIMDYLMFKQSINSKKFSEALINKAMYSSTITSGDGEVHISIKGTSNSE